MAASFLFREADSPGSSGGLSTRAGIMDALDLAADDTHYTLPGNQLRLSFVEENTMRMAYFSPRSRLAMVASLLFCLLAPTARGDETRLSISGYDPVAYFTDGKPVPGSSKFEYVWHDARWRFASAAHRDLFVKDPERYAPQYDGYCALGVAWGQPHKDTVDPNAWAIVDGKLYLSHSPRGLLAWQEKAAENIKRADQNWPTVEHQAEPVIVGPPCRDRPPSVVISYKDGGRSLLVGGQVAVDKDGNVVGKGDMRAQIEQVGKNIQACLEAARAKASDIVETRAFVSDADAFKRNADMLARYLGPLPSASSVNQVSLAAGPEFLVEIEAVANLNSSAAASTEPLRANQ
jgi:enamine deaminase RidA (YjgF/YER057c/UK114 family)